MSAPIKQDVLSPDDPKFYAAPKWRNTDAHRQRPITSPPNERHWDLQTNNPTHYAAIVLADGASSSRPVSDEFEYKNVRVIAVAIVVGVMTWIGLVIVGLERLDAFSGSRIGSGSSTDAKMTVTERLDAANVALEEVSRRALAQLSLRKSPVGPQIR